MALVYGQALPAENMPLAEGTAPAVGSSDYLSRADHRHPRLSSATAHTTNAQGEATIVFTRTYTAPPCMDFTYVEATDNPPVIFKVKSWTQDGQGRYTGCVAKGYRGQALPASLLTLASLLLYNVFGGSAANVFFTAIALEQSIKPT